MKTFIKPELVHDEALDDIVGGEHTVDHVTGITAGGPSCGVAPCALTSGAICATQNGQNTNNRGCGGGGTIVIDF